MADNAILFKYLAKSLGMKHGVQPSFMAKPWGNVSLLVLAFIVHWPTLYASLSSLDVAGESSSKTLRAPNYLHNSAISISLFVIPKAIMHSQSLIMRLNLVAEKM